MKKLYESQVVFVTQKLRSCHSTLKSFSDKDLKSLEVCEIKINQCGSIYVGQTSRNVTTKISEHQKKDSQMGQHLAECSGSTNDSEWKIQDACRTVVKFMTVEALYISKLKLALNIGDEYRVWELMLRY